MRQGCLIGTGWGSWRKCLLNVTKKLLQPQGARALCFGHKGRVCAFVAPLVSGTRGAHVLSRGTPALRLPPPAFHVVSSSTCVSTPSPHTRALVRKCPQYKWEPAHRPFPANGAVTPAHFSRTLRGEEQSRDASRSVGCQPLISPRSLEAMSPHPPKTLPGLALVSPAVDPLALWRPGPGHLPVRECCRDLGPGRHPGMALCSSVRERAFPEWQRVQSHWLPHRGNEYPLLPSVEG